MIIKTKHEFTGDADAARIAADLQAERLLKLWDEARSRAEAAPVGSPAFVRMAELAAAYIVLAQRAGRAGAARGMAGKALAALRDACRREKKDVARHLAFARVLELAAACEVHAGDARAAFDTLRAALVVLGPFAPMLRDRTTDPLVRLALAESLVRPLATVARMLEDAPQRRAAHAQAWDETRAWAKAAKGAADHPSAVEAAVLCAFELAVEESAESAGACLERCEELRPHIESLAKVRGEDTVVLAHRAAFARLTADAWSRLGDRAECATLLAEAARHLDAADRLPNADHAAIAAQRQAIARQRTSLEPAAVRAAPAPAAAAPRPQPVLS